jgi:hypothetical protein
MEPSIGRHGTFDFEFIGCFFHELHALWKVTIFRQIRKLRRRGIFVVSNPDQFQAPSGSGIFRCRSEWSLKIPLSEFYKDDAPTVLQRPASNYIHNLTGIFFPAKNFFTSPTVNSPK